MKKAAAMLAGLLLIAGAASASDIRLDPNTTLTVGGGFHNTGMFTSVTDTTKSGAKTTTQELNLYTASNGADQSKAWPSYRWAGLNDGWPSQARLDIIVTRTAGNLEAKIGGLAEAYDGKFGLNADWTYIKANFGPAFVKLGMDGQGMLLVADDQLFVVGPIFQDNNNFAPNILSDVSSANMKALQAGINLGKIYAEASYTGGKSGGKSYAAARVKTAIDITSSTNLGVEGNMFNVDTKSGKNPAKEVVYGAKVYANTKIFGIGLNAVAMGVSKDLGITNAASGEKVKDNKNGVKLGVFGKASLSLLGFNTWASGTMTDDNFEEVNGVGLDNNSDATSVKVAAHIDKKIMGVVVGAEAGAYKIAKANMTDSSETVILGFIDEVPFAGPAKMKIEAGMTTKSYKEDKLADTAVSKSEALFVRSKLTYWF